MPQQHFPNPSQLFETVEMPRDHPYLFTSVPSFYSTLKLLPSWMIFCSECAQQYAKFLGCLVVPQESALYSEACHFQVYRQILLAHFAMAWWLIWCLALCSCECWAVAKPCWEACGCSCACCVPGPHEGWGQCQLMTKSCLPWRCHVQSHTKSSSVTTWCCGTNSCELVPANWMWMHPGGPLNYSSWWFHNNLACGSQDQC